MRRPGPRLGILPGSLRIRPIAQRGGGNQQPMRRCRDGLNKCLRRVQQMREQRDVLIRPSLAVQPQKLDARRPLPRCSLIPQTIQNPPPRRERINGPPLQTACHPLQPLPRGLLQRLRLHFQPLQESLPQRHQRQAQRFHRVGERGGGRQHIRVHRMQISLKPHRSGQIILLGAGADLHSQHTQKRLRRVLVRLQLRVQPHREHRRGQRLGGAHRGVHLFQHGLIGSGNILQPLGQPPRTGACALRPQQPAPQLRHHRAGQLYGKSTVRRIKNMMPLIKHIARRHVIIVQPTPYRLRHHQRMVGDHEVRLPRIPHHALNDAGGEMRASRMDALPPPVGYGAEQIVPEQFREPARQIAAEQITIGARHRPARDQPQRHGIALHAGGILEIQQAKIILPPLAQHHLGAARQARGLLLDLPLQMPRIGGNPYRALVLLRPQAGGGQIPHRLARAGPGLGQHHMRAAFRQTRLKRRRHRRGIIRLRRALLRPGT